MVVGFRVHDFAFTDSRLMISIHTHHEYASNNNDNVATENINQEQRWTQQHN
jgi:hypothetical protein